MITPRLFSYALAAAVGGASIAPAGAAAIGAGEVQRPEGARHFLLAQPQQASTGKLPLVIVLHGHLGNAQVMFGQTRYNTAFAVWLDIADREKLLVLAPDGVKGSDGQTGWNDCRADASTSPKTDDVGFIAALIRQAVAEHNADPNRIYVMGMSNGGGMAYRLAIELGPQLAGIAALSAVMPTKSLCPEPAHALPVLIEHGTADSLVPYAGGEIGKGLLDGRGTSMGVDDTVALWRRLAKLPDAPVVTALPHREKSDATAATRYVWGADPNQLQVEFLKIAGGGHVEPSIAKRVHPAYAAVLGAQNGDVEIAEEAWTFFKDKRAGLAPNAR